MNKYLLHDVFHIIHNLTILFDEAPLNQIIKYAKECGLKNNRNYSEEMIIKAVHRLERDRKINQVHKNVYWG